jgi:uncharacterized protein DUF3618
MTKKATEKKPEGAARTAATAGPLPSVDPDEIRTDIERTRDDLGETVAQLAAKADVKARAHEAADQAKTQLRDKVTTGVHSVQQHPGELAHKAAGRVAEGAHRARRRPAPAATAATAAGAAAAGTILIALRRRRAARARARPRLWRLWQ